MTVCFNVGWAVLPDVRKLYIEDDIHMKPGKYKGIYGQILSGDKYLMLPRLYENLGSR